MQNKNNYYLLKAKPVFYILLAIKENSNATTWTRTTLKEIYNIISGIPHVRADISEEKYLALKHGLETDVIFWVRYKGSPLQEIIKLIPGLLTEYHNIDSYYALSEISESANLTFELI